MKGIIDNFNFYEMEAMKYYAPPASWTTEKSEMNVREKIFSGDWVAAEKMDGYFSCLIKDDEGNIMLKTRNRGVNGEFADKYEWVPQLKEFAELLPNGTCLLGELYLPSAPGSKNITSLLGCLKEKCIARQEKGEQLHFYVFDCLALYGQSYIGREAHERFDYVETMRSATGAIQEYFNKPGEKFVEFAKYYDGEELWAQLQEVLARGGEGMVLMKKSGTYEPGKRSAKISLKVKQELKKTIDCVIIGANAPTKLYSGKEIQTWQYWQDAVSGAMLQGEYYKDYFGGRAIEPVTKPYFYNWAGSLKIGLIKDGKMTHFGDLSGITDEMKEHWRDYVGRVVEVGGMQVFSDTGSIRHPRLLSVRGIEDKKADECTWDQLS